MVSTQSPIPAQPQGRFCNGIAFAEHFSTSVAGLAQTTAHTAPEQEGRKFMESNSLLGLSHPVPSRLGAPRGTQQSLQHTYEMVAALLACLLVGWKLEHIQNFLIQVVSRDWDKAGDPDSWRPQKVNSHCVLHSAVVVECRLYLPPPSYVEDLWKLLINAFSRRSVLDHRYLYL